MKFYNERTDINKLYKDHILKSLQSRRDELALYAVAYDMDTEMLKSLISSGGLKKLMKK